MTDFVWGVLTPFLALGGLALAAGAAWFLIAAARHLWGQAHYALMGVTKLRPNRARAIFKGEPEDDRPEYLDAANRFRDALLQSPRMYTVAGLGWRAVLVRETRDADNDEVLS